MSAGEGKAKIYLGLLHYPVLDKDGRTITTAVTSADLHDLARLAPTYGVKAFYVIQPLPLQRKLVERLLEYWQRGGGGQYNWTRKEAFLRMRLVETFAEALASIRAETGATPKVVGTSARLRPGALGAARLREEMKNGVWLLLFGTGWGMVPEFLAANADFMLKPIAAAADYNHLSVRTAAAIVLDRLLGDREE